MRETKFIEQNKEKWAEYESMLQSGRGEPEKLNDLFVQITDDLSYARTFYPNRSVRVYLNQLGQRIFHHIYKGRDFSKIKIGRFWMHDLPQVLWESRMALRLGLALFVCSFAIGVLSSMIDPDFARVILGDQYVEMTLANIEKGDPMAVYKDNQPLGSALGIAGNNLFVAFRTAVFGVMASIGTAFMLMYNGIMVGTFQFFFIDKGLFRESFLAIWIHGTLEISAIILAGGAGLTAGSGLLFPGTFSRKQAFQITMRRGMKIFAGIVPVIILAAFFEGFLTRFTEIPDIFRVIFILASLVFVVGYFVVFPRMKARRGDFVQNEKDADLPPEAFTPISFNTIKSAGEIISDTFTIIKRHLKWVLVLVFSSALLFTLFRVNVPFEGEGDGYGRDFNFQLTAFFGRNMTDATTWVMAGVFVLISYAGTHIVRREMAGWQFKTNITARIIQFFAVLLPIFLLFSWFQRPFISNALPFFVLLFSLYFLPFIIASYWLGATHLISTNPYPNFLNALMSLRHKTPYFIGAMVLGFFMLFVLIDNTELYKLFVQFFSWAVPPGAGNMQRFSEFVRIFTLSAALSFSWLLFVISGILHVFSHLEIVQAGFLLHQIKNIGTTRQIRGLPKE